MRKNAGFNWKLICFCCRFHSICASFRMSNHSNARKVDVWKHLVELRILLWPRNGVHLLHTPFSTRPLRNCNDYNTKACNTTAKPIETASSRSMQKWGNGVGHTRTRIWIRRKIDEDSTISYGSVATVETWKSVIVLCDLKLSWFIPNWCGNGIEVIDIVVIFLFREANNAVCHVSTAMAQGAGFVTENHVARLWAGDEITT